MITFKATWLPYCNDPPLGVVNSISVAIEAAGSPSPDPGVPMITLFDDHARKVGEAAIDGPFSPEDSRKVIVLLSEIVVKEPCQASFFEMRDPGGTWIARSDVFKQNFPDSWLGALALIGYR